MPGFGNGTPQGFVASLQTWTKKTQRGMENAIRLLTLTAYSDLKQRSPIDTKRFRDSWRYAINAPDTSVEERRKRSHMLKNLGGQVPPSAEEMEPALSASLGFKAGDKIFITNSLPYADALENGHSPQGSGFVALTREELLANFRRIRVDDLPADIG